MKNKILTPTTKLSYFVYFVIIKNIIVAVLSSTAKYNRISKTNGYLIFNNSSNLPISNIY